jgi:hypothetical protein
MTKIQAQFKLIEPLNLETSQRLADTSSLYGILRIHLDAQRNDLTVEYDATRLKEQDVEAALARAGVAAQLLE